LSISPIAAPAEAIGEPSVHPQRAASALPLPLPREGVRLQWNSAVTRDGGARCVLGAGLPL